MSNFAILPTDPQADLYGAVNYLLATQGQGGNANAVLGNSLVANTTSGQITTIADPNYLAYLYQYMNVRYADSADGSVGFSTSPTNKHYFGVRNTPTTPGSSNPADYVWTAVTGGGFSTTNFLYYQTNGGRQIQFKVNSVPPGDNFIIVQDATPINLDILSASLVNTTIQIVYSDGQIFNKDSANVWSPPASGNIISTVANVSVLRSNTVIGAIGQTISYNAASQTWSSTTNPQPNISPSSFTFGTNISSASNYYRTVNYADTFANVTAAETVTVVASGQNGAPGANGAPGSNGISYYTYTVYARSNVQPPAPLANTGSWDFTTGVGTPPNFPAQGNLTVSGIAGNGQVRTDYVNAAGGVYKFLTLYSNYNFNHNSGPELTNVLTYNGNLTVSSNSVVDVFLVGSGGYGEPYAFTSANVLVTAGASGGNALISNGVSLTSGTYRFQFGHNADTWANIAGNLIATKGLSGPTLANLNYAAGGSAANSTPISYVAGTTYGYNGRNGIADPWQQITWAGNISNGVAYFGGGGGSGQPNAAIHLSNSVGTGGLGGGGFGGNAFIGLNGQDGSWGGGGGGGSGTSTLSAGYSGTGVIVIREFIPNVYVTWSNSVPSGNTTLYSTQALAYIQGNVGVASNLTWSTPGQVGAQGDTGSRGFIPLAYIITASNPTSYTDAQYTSAFSANRNNVSPPIGTGYAPVDGDTAQFFYPAGNVSVFKTYSSATAPNWQNVTGQVIDGNVLVSGTVTASKLAANDIYALTIQSTNATVGNTSSNGFWLQANTGNARFGGNVSIGSNLTVAGLISTSTLNANVVSGVNIVNGSITADKLAANVVVVANSIQSNNATFGSYTSDGFWLDANTGNARFAGYTSVGNSLVIGNNLTVGNNASIGGNLSVAGLINGGSLQSNTVVTTTIIPTSVTTVYAFSNQAKNVLKTNPPFTYFNTPGNYQFYSQLWTSGSSIQNTISAADYPYGRMLISGQINTGFTSFTWSGSVGTSWQPWIRAQIQRYNVATSTYTVVYDSGVVNTFGTFSSGYNYPSGFWPSYSVQFYDDTIPSAGIYRYYWFNQIGGYGGSSGTASATELWVSYETLTTSYIKR